jgi:hypothetical protein
MTAPTIDEPRTEKNTTPAAARLATALEAAIVAAACLFVFLQLQPDLIFANTTPAGGDMGAHVWGPAYLRDNVLPHGRITGWTRDWYLGFPAYHFYFPLPNLLIVAIDAIPGVAYGPAFKLVTALGPTATPAAAAALGRLLRLKRPAPALMAIATLPFLFDRFHTIWGGNIPATLAGEFSFSIALALSLLFIGFLYRALETGHSRHRVAATALLAATALTHLLPALFATLAAGIILVTRRPDRPRWQLAAITGMLGAGLTAFWLLPFLARLRYSNDMGWERTFAYVENLLPFLRDDVPDAQTNHLWLVVPLAIAGAVVSIKENDRAGRLLTGLALVTALGFRFMPDGPLWNARLLPFWYLAVYLLAGYAVAQALQRLTTSNVARTAAAAATLALTLLLVGAPLRALPDAIPVSTLDKSFIPDWARWNYSGYERKAAYPEYRHVVQTMASLGRTNGCGRAMWEYEPQLDRYGTPMALMLLPHWTDGCIGSMEGLFFESSATVPYHFLNQSELSKTPSRAQRDLPYRELDVTQGVEHLKLLGVRYYMAQTPEAQAQADANPDLTLVASTDSYPVNYPDGTKDRSWKIYEVADTELVVPLEAEPVVVADGDGHVRSKEGWLETGVGWYQDTDRWNVHLADDGPDRWKRIDDTTDDPVVETPVRPARISNIDGDRDDRISFDVDRPGSPVLIRESYFPNWKAKGADGPYRVTPNLMVVIPTDTHVELRYGWTPVDIAGWATTFIALGLTVLVARRRPVKLPEPPPPPPEDHDDPFFVEPSRPLVEASTTRQE